MVPGSQRPEMVDVIPPVQLWVPGNDRLIPRLELLPDLGMACWRLGPGATVVLAAIVRTAVRNGALNRRTDMPQVIWQLVRLQARLHRQHTTTNVHPDSRRDD